MIIKNTKRIAWGVLPAALVAVCSVLFLSGRADAACSVDTSRGTYTNSFTAPADGSYTFWARMQATSANNDSVFISIDGSDCITVGDADVPVGSWKWVNYQNGQTGNITKGVQLVAGNHTIQLFGREDGVKIDRMLLLSSGCTPSPTGNGDDCVTVNDTQAPTVAVTSPPANSQLTGSAKIDVQANDDIAVTKVDVKVDGTVNKSFTTSPYSYFLDTSAFADGSHTITAIAYDAAGHSTTSYAVTAKFVNTTPAANKAPTVSLGSPSNSYNDPADITLNASASDSDGSIAKVEFFNGTTKLGESTTSPYTYKWTGVTSGDYSVTARATDNQAAVTTSQPLAISVKKVVAVTDGTSPSAPTGLTRSLYFDATRFTYAIGLNWKASSDNVGVTNYVVTRNGVVINKPTTTSFIDTQISANTEYTYSVQAQDAAGLLSKAATTKIKGACFLLWCTEN